MLGIQRDNGKENGNYYTGISHYRPPKTLILIMGTPKKGAPNFGKPPYAEQQHHCHNMKHRSNLCCGKDMIFIMIVVLAEATAALELEQIHTHMGGCQIMVPFWGTLNIRCRIVIGYNRDPKRAHNFDNHPRKNTRPGHYGKE